MSARTLVFLAVLLTAAAASPLCQASSRAAETDEFEELRQQVREVLAQMSEMRREHAAEIAALRGRIAELAQARSAGVRPPNTMFETDDLEALRRAAEAETEKESKVEKAADETIFKSGNLGLQALNPEISITGDMLGYYRAGDEVPSHWDYDFRALGIHFEAYLDPYSRFKAAVPVNAEGAELGEAYYTRYGVFRNVNLTLGKFRQQFGVVNRWHKHALDYFDFPLPLRSIFGPGGLNGTGVSLDWTGSIGSAFQEVVLQSTDGDNLRMFGENAKNRPSVLAHYKVYQDLSPSTYVQLGATGLLGWNDHWATVGDAVDESLTTQVYGLDFSLLWEPTARMRYRNVEWRNEFYFVNKEIQAPDGSGTDRLNPWGAYSAFQTKVSRTLDLGLRFEYYRPDSKTYADIDPALSLYPLAVTDSDANRYLLGAYATWFQSPFVKFRFGYAYEGGDGMEEEQRIATFQIVFAAGPHKHERY
jgi:hypothetical protein